MFIKQYIWYSDYGVDTIQWLIWRLLHSNIHIVIPDIDPASVNFQHFAYALFFV